HWQMSAPNRVPAPKKFWLGCVLKTSNQPVSLSKLMSALPPKADMDHHGRDVRFVPKADIVCCAHFRWRARLFADLFLLTPATLLPERADPRVICGRL